MRKSVRSAFTLLEVALSIGILVVGLTGIISVYMVSLSWAEEIRVDLTALQTARIVLADATILTDENDLPQNFDNRDTEAKGWVNDYFAVRTFDEAESVDLPGAGNGVGSAGEYVKVRVQVYYGGNDEDGLLAHELFCHQIILPEYKP
ncbi:MAG: type II secretion system protein [Planctomycetes bacterium]|nr:type II secretion system protein [Planctomycetota bacterium]